MQNTNKYNKGITIVALVITVVVLSILTGVTIAYLTQEEEGIIDNTKKAVEKEHERDQREEEILENLRGIDI